MEFEFPVVHWPLPAVLGYLLVLLALWNVLGAVYPVLRFCKKYCRCRSLIDRCGRDSWAAVTGASYGIGLGFARTLAAQGFNIVLIARSADTLQKVAEGLELLYGVRTRVLVLDFMGQGSDFEGFYNSLCAQLEEVDVSVLVNNVGWGEVCFYEDQSLEGVTQTLELNIWPALALSRWALEKMQSRSQESAVINLSSAASIAPVPTSALYSATKMFVHFLTRTLANEKSLHNIHFLSLRSAFVNTPMVVRNELDSEHLIISIDECAQAALEHLGTAPYTMGHWKHRLVRLLLFFVPESLNASLIIKKFKCKQPDSVARTAP